MGVRLLSERMKLLPSVLVGLSYGQLWNWNRGARPSPAENDEKHVISGIATDEKPNSGIVHDDQDFIEKEKDHSVISSPTPSDEEHDKSRKDSPSSMDHDDEFNEFYNKFVDHLHGFVKMHEDYEEERDMEEEEKERFREDEVHDEMLSAMQKGCNDCGGTVNNNFAPLNTNIQNFVDVNTNVNTNYNVNIGNTISESEKNWWPKEDKDQEWEFPMKEEWEKDPKKCIQEIKEFIHEELGFEVSDEMISMI